MVKAISKYTFLLRVGEKRLTVQRGQLVTLTDEELQKFRNKFIPHQEHANNSKNKGM